jgi:hypothetical protein
MKRKLKRIKPIYECRCNGRLQTKRFTRLAHTTGWSWSPEFLFVSFLFPDALLPADVLTTTNARRKRGRKKSAQEPTDPSSRSCQLLSGQVFYACLCCMSCVVRESGRKRWCVCAVVCGYMCMHACIYVCVYQYLYFWMHADAEKCFLRVSCIPSCAPSYPPHSAFKLKRKKFKLTSELMYACFPSFPGKEWGERIQTKSR